MELYKGYDFSFVKRVWIDGTGKILRIDFKEDFYGFTSDFPYREWRQALYEFGKDEDACSESDIVAEFFERG